MTHLEEILTDDDIDEFDRLLDQLLRAIEPLEEAFSKETPDWQAAYTAVDTAPVETLRACVLCMAANELLLPTDANVAAALEYLRRLVN